MTICVYAAASENIDACYVKDAELLGKELAKSGHRLIYGAGSTGLMGAVARGFRQGNGEVIGVAPEFMKTIEPIFYDCTEFIQTKDMSERKNIMEQGADLFVILPGGIGTMDEFFQAITLRYLNQLDKNIVIYNDEGYYDDIISFMDKGINKGFIGAKNREYYSVASTPEELLNIIDNM